MLKLVVLCTFLAAAAGKPDLFITPAVYSTSVVEPAKTTISQQASSVIHSSPVVYTAAYPFAHFIKKRSVPLTISSYIAPTTYLASTPLTTTYSYIAPFVHTSSVLPAADIYTTTHLIKKRSAALISTPIVAPSTYLAAAPLATSYSTTYVNRSPLLSAPFSYVSSAHYIKKRSAPLVTSYVTPSIYAAPWFTSIYSPTSTLISSYPIGYPSYFFKK